jgi:hypothetical protein
MLNARSGAVVCLALFGLFASGCELITDVIEHGKGGATGGGSGPTAPTPPPGGGVSSCFGGGSASAPRDPNSPIPPSSCKSAGEWTQHAYEICTASKATLTDLQLTQPCGGDLYAGMSYSCCLPGSTPSDPGPVTPPPPKPVCKVEVLDDGPVCVSGSALKDRAYKACADQGLVLTNLGFGGVCADNVSYVGAKYECCSPSSSPGTPKPPTPPDTTPPPSTPGGACRKGSDGGPTSCKDAGTWKLYASDTCKQAGMVLTEVHPRESCGDNLYRYSDFVCCTN